MKENGYFTFSRNDYQALCKFFFLWSFQIVVKKEQSATYDAGIAIDDVALIDCPLKRPTESDCPVDEWKCENQVNRLTYFLGT